MVYNKRKVAKLFLGFTPLLGLLFIVTTTQKNAAVKMQCDVDDQKNEQDTSTSKSSKTTDNSFLFVDCTGFYE